MCNAPIYCCHCVKIDCIERGKQKRGVLIQLSRNMTPICSENILFDYGNTLRALACCKILKVDVFLFKLCLSLAAVIFDYGRT